MTKDFEYILEGLEYTEKNLKKNAKKFAKQLANNGRKEAQRTYGSKIPVKIEETANGYDVVAESPLVLFFEFGTGVYAGDSNPLKENLVHAEAVPGSWSREHANTWEDWISSGKDPNEYPFNHRPKRGMLACDRAVKRNAKKIFERVFRFEQI